MDTSRARAKRGNLPALGICRPFSTATSMDAAHPTSAASARWVRPRIKRKRFTFEPNPLGGMLSGYWKMNTPSRRGVFTLFTADEETHMAKPTRDDEPLGKGEMKNVNDKWRRDTRAQMKRLNISVRELARRIGASEGSVSEVLNPAHKKTQWSWVDACAEALRREEANPQPRQRAPRLPGAARDDGVSLDEIAQGMSAEECRNLLAGYVRTMPIDEVHAWMAWFKVRPR
jgi:hypothetical protein